MLEAYCDLGDQEEFFTINLFEIGLGALDLLQAAFFAHAGEGPKLGDP